VAPRPDLARKMLHFFLQDDGLIAQSANQRFGARQN